jgi:AraC-like DNA-binding protein
MFRAYRATPALPGEVFSPLRAAVLAVGPHGEVEDRCLGYWVLTRRPGIQKRGDDSNVKQGCRVGLKAGRSPGGSGGSFASDDLDEILEWYARHARIRMSASRTKAFMAPGLHLDDRRVGGVRIARSRVPDDLTIITASTDAYVLTIVGAGGLQVHEARERWDLSPVVAGLYRPPREPRRNRIAAGTDLIYLQIARRDLERQLEELIEDSVMSPVDFDPQLTLTGPTTWRRLLGVFTDVLDDTESVVHRPIVSEPLTEAMINALLYCADHPYQAILRQPTPPAKPRHIRVVIDAVHAEPERAYTVARLAHIAGVSVRSLQQGFRSHVGMPPITYLRRVRLARVHDQLKHGETATVAEAAHRWGFTHLGRFSAAYAAVYGVAPSVTRSASR